MYGRRLGRDHQPWRQLCRRHGVAGRRTKPPERTFRERGTAAHALRQLGDERRLLDARLPRRHRPGAELPGDRGRRLPRRRATRRRPDRARLLGSAVRGVHRLRERRGRSNRGLRPQHPLRPAHVGRQLPRHRRRHAADAFRCERRRRGIRRPPRQPQRYQRLRTHPRTAPQRRSRVAAGTAGSRPWRSAT